MRHPERGRVRIAGHPAPLRVLGALILLPFLALAAPAQETRVDPSQAEELLEVERALDGAEISRDEAQTRARAAARIVRQLQEQLVAAGDRAQALESAIADRAGHLDGLTAARAVSEAILAARREQLVEALAALQRLDLDPPPALLVNPQDALSAARGAILLGTLVPELKSVADEISAQIRALDDLTRTIEAESRQLARDAEALEAEQRRIDELLVAKREEELVTTADARRAAERYASLAGRAKSLRDLLGGLERDVPTVAALTPDLAEEAVRPDFASLRGHLRSPASGRIVRAFGAEDLSGDEIQGLSLEGRPRAQVVSPADAEIVFAGPFRSYGNVLIITPGDNYLIVLAGLAEIYATPGQQVLAGEPVGRLPEQAAKTGQGPRTGRGTAGDASRGPLLYIELRKDGAPIDPAPWIRFASRPA
ncbi:peptidoglycan DD-metalloendopeptidase family protein [Pyruvatibacter mobilis]|uniref:Peptidoglycan DD-metalloendopeptidase family protein n=1 Tax=Pyruvatibacter mobilis TaxID=1712261 RepID=A0A845Q723_9HYPH|nr:peptidoglycan DD-metalloendopeptidase family protein [Pyruvatibacter mobilis]NBG94292.1 peptidoglycan DD-metalloendopeptidase family protein [Pyruvatibacter mobilis]QJD76590.1 peptidoglycan DD-metalloendopeptidase family protein [Pyruvatibacter mobilis]